MLILYVDLVMSCNYIVASSHWTEIVEDHGRSIILEMSQMLEESSAYGYSMICLRSMPCSGAQLSTSQNLRAMETFHFLGQKQEETWATLGISILYINDHDESTSGTAAEAFKKWRAKWEEKGHGMAPQCSTASGIVSVAKALSRLRRQRVLPPFHHPILNVRQGELATPKPLSCYLRPKIDTKYLCWTSLSFCKYLNPWECEKCNGIKLLYEIGHGKNERWNIPPWGHLFFRIEMDPELTEEALGARQFAPAGEPIRWKP